MSAAHTSARRKLTPMPKENKGRQKFAPATFEAVAEDLQSGRIPLDKMTITDDVQPGLRAIVRNTGLISFHVSYEIDGTRPYLKIGDHPGTTVSQAREIAKTVRVLAGMGIDPQEGLHTRLMRELLEKGTKWRP